MKPDVRQPAGIVLACVLLVFVISRLIAYLVLVRGVLPYSLFVSVHGFRLHHFVYGNTLIVATGFLSIVTDFKISRNWLAVFYGIGLGLVLDEFPLWMGDVSQLNSNVAVIPYAPSAVLIVCGILLVLLLKKNKSS